ncbi:uncharacterized protein LOC113852105 [Abrus precatorius]|uniref:Uncharacterized protein LOC113852105 n=1 Tax=Abrus precatorius TaxID=3816 RepID=A0A8B8K4Z3_ABRPR|nr:uncharacterized protein LOC113852105 [Abrus precatorius]
MAQRFRALMNEEEEQISVCEVHQMEDHVDVGDINEGPQHNEGPIKEKKKSTSLEAKVPINSEGKNPQTKVGKVQQPVISLRNPKNKSIQHNLIVQKDNLSSKCQSDPTALDKKKIIMKEKEAGMLCDMKKMAHYGNNFIDNFTTHNCYPNKEEVDFAINTRIKNDVASAILKPPELIRSNCSGSEQDMVIDKSRRPKDLDAPMVDTTLGSIWCLWDTNSWKVDVIISDVQFIHMKVQWHNDDPWFLTAVYGNPQALSRRDLWYNLKNIAQSVSYQPWCLVGDFNATLNSWDRKGGSRDTQNLACPLFQAFMRDCNIVDVGFVGSPFTWKYGTLYERLARIILNLDWRLRFEQMSVCHLSPFKSNNNLLLMDFHNSDGLNRGRRPFRFVAAWLTHEDLPNVVRNL